MGNVEDVVDLTADVASLVLPPSAVEVARRAVKLVVRRWGRLEGDELQRELSQVLLSALTVGVLEARTAEDASVEWLADVAGLLHGEVVREPSDLQPFVDAVVGQGNVEGRWAEALEVAIGRLDRDSLEGAVDARELVVVVPRRLRFGLGRAAMRQSSTLLPLWEQLCRQPRWAHPMGTARYDIDALVDYYRQVFAGRRDELAALDGWMEQSDSPFAFVHEPTGRGKTALLVHFVDRMRLRADWEVVFVPISRRFHTDDAPAIWQALAGQLAACHEEQLERGDTAPSEFRERVASFLRRPLLSRRRLLVVVDGIDEAVGWQLSPGLFGLPTDTAVKIVVSARQFGNKSREAWLRELGWRLSQVYLPPTLAPLGRGDVSNMVSQLLPVIVHSFDRAVDDIMKITKGDPLTLRLVIDDLVSGEVSPGQLTLRRAGLKNYFFDTLTEIASASANSEAVFELLGCCAVALGPLTHDDLAALSPTLNGQLERIAATRDVARYIVGDGSLSFGFVFSHPSLRELYLGEMLDRTERQAFADRFLDYGHATWSQSEGPPSAYVRRFWITHLADNEHWDTVRAVAAELSTDATGRRYQPWAWMRYQAEGSYTGYLTDVDYLWQHAEAQENLATAYRCALITARIRSFSGSLHPQLLVQLVTTGTPDGCWSLQTAIEHIEQMPQARGGAQGAALVLLTESVANRPDQFEAIPWNTLLTTARKLSRQFDRAVVLTRLAPHLPEGLLTQALDAARELTDLYCRAVALDGLAPRLPEPGRSEELAKLLTAARQVIDPRPMALACLIPHLPEPERPEVLAEALTAARQLTDQRTRMAALALLIPHVPESERPEVLAVALTAARRVSFRDAAWRALLPNLPEPERSEAIAEALADARRPPNAYPWDSAMAGWLESRRCWELVALIPHLDEPELSEALGEALTAARQLADQQARVEMLAALAPLLPDSERLELLVEELTAARLLTDQQTPIRAEVLARLAPHLPKAERVEVLAEALAAVREHTDQQAPIRAEVLAGLAPHLSNADRLAVFAEALTAARQLGASRPRVLSLLVPHLPEPERSEVPADALTAVRQLTDPRVQARALAVLAPCLPKALLAPALAAAYQLNNEWARARALAGLAPHLPEALLAQALTATRLPTNARARAEAMAGLGPHLPETLLPEALTTARQINDQWARARALAGLAPHLPEPERSDVLLEALTAARRLPYVRARAEVLCALAPHVTEAMPEALTAARQQSDQTVRTDVLVRLAPLVPHRERPEVLSEALTAVRQVADQVCRASALARLAPHLNDLLLEALTATSELTDQWARAAVLVELNDGLTTAAHETAIGHRELWLRLQRDLANEGYSALWYGIASLSEWLSTIAHDGEVLELLPSLMDVEVSRW